MAYTIANPIIGTQPIANTETVQKHPLGLIVTAIDPVYGVGEFIYLSGVASTVLGSWVTYNQDDNSTTLLAANAIGPVGVAMSINVASQYGWYQISGVAQANGLTSITHTSGFLALTGTAGSLDDASVIGDHVYNARKTTTVHVVGTFLDTYNIARPFSTNLVTVRN